MPERTVQMPIGDAWIVEMTWHEGSYEGGPASIWIRPADSNSPPPGGLSSAVVRGINFRAGKAQLYKEIEKSPHGWRGSPALQKAMAEERAERLRYELSKGITNDYLALLSSEYILRVNSGQPKPVENLASDLGKPLQTVRGHLWKARKLELLKGSPGRKGGELSMEAMTLLQRMPKPARAISQRQPPSMIDPDPPAGAEDLQGDR